MNRTQVLTIILAIWIPVFGMVFAIYREIQKEMKDFHGRLCSAEEKYRSKEKK
jgi:hypothetical protein